MQCRVILLDTTGTPCTFFERDKNRKERKKKNEGRKSLGTHGTFQCGSVQQSTADCWLLIPVAHTGTIERPFAVVSFLGTWHIFICLHPPSSSPTSILAPDRQPNGTSPRLPSKEAVSRRELQRRLLPLVCLEPRPWTISKGRGRRKE